MCAVERDSSFVNDLQGVVSTRLTNFNNTVTNIRARQDADFATKVLNDGLTYDQQLAYYQSRLDNEKSKDYPDANYISTLNSNVANLKKLVKYQKFNDQYTQDFNLYSTGRGSIDTLINEVKSMIDQTTDQTERSNLQSTLSQLTTQKFKDAQQLIQNNITLATNDQSIPTLQSMLSELQNDQVGASASGNAELASSYATQIQTIKSNISSIQVQQATNSINLQVLNSGSNSIQKLSILSNLVSSSDTSTPVNIGGTLFPSMQAYWSAQQNAYLSGAGTGLFKDFFGDLKAETNAKVNVLASSFSNGAVSVSDMQNIKSIFSSLASNPAIAPYLNQLLGTQTDVMSTLATNNANAILAEYSRTENYQTALNNLTNLESITGVNQAINKSNLVVKEAGAKLQEASNIAAGNPNARISPDVAVSQTPEDLAKMGAGELPVPGAAPTTVTPVTPTIPTTPTTPTTTPKPNSYYQPINGGQSQQQIDNQKLMAQYTSQYGGYVINPDGSISPKKTTTSTPAAAPATTPAPKTTTPATTTPVAATKPAVYSGVSIVDYLSSTGQKSDYTTRSQLAKTKGIANYAGTAEQNTQLLKALRGY